MIDVLEIEQLFEQRRIRHLRPVDLIFIEEPERSVKARFLPTVNQRHSVYRSAQYHSRFESVAKICHHISVPGIHVMIIRKRHPVAVARERAHIMRHVFDEA